jgi:hypothetical protein
MDCLWLSRAVFADMAKTAQEDDLGTGNRKKRDICGLLRFLNEKNRIKWG